MQAKEGAGLFSKFVVHRRRVAGVEIQPVRWPAFVLRIDGTDPAAMEALRAYALTTKDAHLASSIGQVLCDCGYESWAGIFARHGLPDTWPPREEDDKEVPGRA